MSIIAGILAFLANPVGRWLVTTACVATFFGAWLWRHDVKVAQRAEEAVLERSAKAGKKAAAKSVSAHRAAAKPGAAARAMRKYCVDCKP